MNLPPSSRSRNVLGRLLAASFALVVLLTVVGAALGSAALARIDRSTTVAVDHNLVAERMASEVYRLVALNSERYKSMALSSEPGVQESLAAEARTAETRYRQMLKQLRQYATEAESSGRLVRVEAADARFAKAAHALRSAVDTNFTAAIQKEFADRFQPASHELLEAVDLLASTQRAAIDAAVSDVHRQSVEARWSLAGFALAAMALSILMAWRLTGRISRPIVFASETAARVASFDLAQEILGHSRDEAGQLLAALGRMQQNLRGLVSQVSESAQSLHAAGHEMAQGNQDLSSRTEETASSLDRTAEALDLVTRGLHESSQKLADAREQATVAASDAVDGGQLVAHLVDRMRDIEQDGARVREIVSMIDEIAFQTNLLALNAAVEAARAGEHGRGFAVVATEVRQLSRRSAAAAQDVRGLITQSVESIRAGAALAARAGQAVASGVQSMQGVAAEISQIAATTRSLGAEITGVNQSMALVSEATQQNTALVEQSAAAAQQLQAEAESLTILISRCVLPAKQEAREPQLRARSPISASSQPVTI